MKIATFLARVDEDTCTGCGNCEVICPARAIGMAGKKAEITEGKCVACNKCWDVCPVDAIAMVARPQPVVFGTDPLEVDQEKLMLLCRKAGFHPDQPICPCSSTQSKEVAAAILKGAKTMEEITLMTGARSGCGIYCVQPIFALLNAHDGKLLPPTGLRLPGLWNIPEEIIRKYPGHFIEEDREFLRPDKGEARENLSAFSHREGDRQ